MGLVYRIKNWDSCFENERSRQVRRCSFVCVPNKRGVGLSHLLALKNGDAFFGIFVLIAESCSRQERPRTGWMTDDGTPSGRPWDAEDIATNIGVGVTRIVSALAALSSPRVGWIEQADPKAAQTKIDHRPGGGRGQRGKRAEKGDESKQNPRHTPDTHDVPTEYPPDKGREGKRREYRKTSTSFSPATARAATGADDTSPVVLTFPVVAGKRGGPNTWQLRRSYVNELAEAFIGIDIAGEARKALAWVKANRKKTASGMPRFLTSWMTRATNNGTGKRSAPSTGVVTDDEPYEKSDEEMDQMCRDAGIFSKEEIAAMSPEERAKVVIAGGANA